jgi:hypothetical protein
MLYIVLYIHLHLSFPWCPCSLGLTSKILYEYLTFHCKLQPSFLILLDAIAHIAGAYNRVYIWPNSRQKCKLILVMQFWCYFVFITHYMQSCSVLEEIMLFYPVYNLSIFNANQIFVSFFTTSRYVSLSWAWLIQSTTAHPVSLSLPWHNPWPTRKHAVHQ